MGNARSRSLLLSLWGNTTSCKWAKWPSSDKVIFERADSLEDTAKSNASASALRRPCAEAVVVVAPLAQLAFFPPFVLRREESEWAAQEEEEAAAEEPLA
jgi:hypothetical protein